MAELNDLKFTALRKEGYTGSIDDMEQQWLLSEVAPAPDQARHVNDLWLVYLQQVEGRTEESLPDARYQWLSDMALGVGSQFSNMWFEYWRLRSEV